ncbi:MAG: methyl-accepting chemotaxis protein [Rickettsiales endosymbiont of Dermacentor nuttalli]
MTIKKKLLTINVIQLFVAIMVLSTVYLVMLTFTNTYSEMSKLSKVQFQLMDAYLAQTRINDFMVDLRINSLKGYLQDKNEVVSMVTKYKESHDSIMRKILKENTNAELELEINNLLAQIDKIDLEFIEMSKKFCCNIVALGTYNLHMNFKEIEKLYGGVFQKIRILNDNFNDVQYKVITLSKQAIIITAIFYILIIVVVNSYFLNLIIRPFSNIIKIMHKIAIGENNIDIPYKEYSDEIGDLAKGLDIFRQNNLHMEQINEEKDRTQQALELHKKNTLKEIANKFDTTVRNIADMVVSAAVEIEITAKNMVNSVKENTTYIDELVRLSSYTSGNVNMVASAAEELSTSVIDISTQMIASSEITREAVKKSYIANNAVQSLANSTNKIGDIVSLINDIAEQINLLALNATIEAARAGEAGKGFAVVAAEVKNLASQTAKATEEITVQISSIQSEASSTVEVIKKIGEIIEEINNISSNISSTVRQQGSSTQEIANNIQEAAKSVQDVSKNAKTVLETTSDSTRAISDMVEACAELARQSNILNEDLDKFLSVIKS